MGRYPGVMFSSSKAEPALTGGTAPVPCLKPANLRLGHQHSYIFTDATTPVDISELTWEQKEKVLRSLFAMMNGLKKSPPGAGNGGTGAVLAASTSHSRPSPSILDPAAQRRRIPSMKPLQHLAAIESARISNASNSTEALLADMQNSVNSNFRYTQLLMCVSVCLRAQDMRMFALGIWMKSIFVPLPPFPTKSVYRFHIPSECRNKNESGREWIET